MLSSFIITVAVHLHTYCVQWTRLHELHPAALSIQLSELRLNTNQRRKQSIVSSWNIDEWCGVRLWLHNLQAIPQLKHNILSTERTMSKKWDCSFSFLPLFLCFLFSNVIYLTTMACFTWNIFKFYYLSDLLCEFRNCKEIVRIVIIRSGQKSPTKMN